MQRIAVGNIVIFASDETDPQELARIAVSPALIATRTIEYTVAHHCDGVLLRFRWCGSGPPSLEDGVAACNDPVTQALAQPDGLTRAQRIRKGLTLLLAYWTDAEIDALLAPFLPDTLFTRTSPSLSASDATCRACGAARGDVGEQGLCAACIAQWWARVCTEHASSGRVH